MIKSARALSAGKMIKGARDIKGISREARRTGTQISIPYSAEFVILGKWKERLELENAFLEKRRSANCKKIDAIREKMARFGGETRRAEGPRDETEEIIGMKCKKMTLRY